MVKITADEMRSMKGPNQIYDEWRSFLQFCQVYFQRRRIVHPLVVEIGTQNGHQKAFYTKFLDADHIGIDISDQYSMPDILGDSKAPETMQRLWVMLNGRPVNLLFIDAYHTYEDANAEYGRYGPMVEDIIAFHDIRHVKGIGDLWNDIRARERGNSGLTFLSIGAWGHGWCELGIGIIAKRPKDEINEILKDYKALRDEQYGEQFRGIELLE